MNGSEAERASLTHTGAAVLANGTSVDRFLIEQLVKEGASARVYRARDAAGELVALKVLRSELPRPRDAVERFALEARACIELRAPNLPRLIGSGRLADGAPYLALTYFAGPSLRDAVAVGPLSTASVLQLGAELATALYDVHNHGFVHCDVDPDNVILSDRPDGTGLRATAALIGFGECRRLDGDRASAALGSPISGFSAPELALGAGVTARSDVFSLGAVLYFALTGRAPLSGATAQEIVRSIRREPIVPVCSLRSDCQPELERAVMRALRREPDQRWSSARRFAEELAWYQARWGLGLLRSWGDEPRTGSRAISEKHRIDGLPLDGGGSGFRRRA